MKSNSEAVPPDHNNYPDPEVTAGRDKPVDDVTAGRDKRKRTRPKGYYDWKPQAKTRRILEQVDEILVEYERYLPMTVRQIFYRLVGAYDYPKTDLAYEGLITKLSYARRARMIPFSAIRDDGIRTYETNWHDGPAAFWDDVAWRARDYRRDRQLWQPCRIELWTESAGMMPQLSNVADDYSVPVYSCGGQPSVTANRQVAERALRQTVPTVLLHVGDFDPDGDSIFETMAADIVEFVKADRVIQNLEVLPIRVALTAGQVEEFALPTAPPKEKSSRTANWEGKGTCQLEALTPDQLAEIVRSAIEDFMDLDRLQHQIDLEQDERTQLLHALPSGDS